MRAVRLAGSCLCGLGRTLTVKRKPLLWYLALTCCPLPETGLFFSSTFIVKCRMLEASSLRPHIRKWCGVCDHRV